MSVQASNSAERARDSGGRPIFSEGGNGATHVAVHDLCDRNQFHKAHSVLRHWLDRNNGHDSDLIHLHFHMGLCDLELGNWHAAYQRFMNFILPAAATTTNALTDAPALLWLLQSQAPGQITLPWAPLGHTAASQLRKTRDPFIQLHNALAICGAGGAKKRFASELLWRLIPAFTRVGGSTIQNRLLGKILDRAVGWHWRRLPLTV